MITPDTPKCVYVHTRGRKALQPTNFKKEEIMKPEVLKEHAALENVIELQREALDRLIYQNNSKLMDPESALIELDLRFLYEGLAVIELLLEQRETRIEDLEYDLRKIKKQQTPGSKTGKTAY